MNWGRIKGLTPMEAAKNELIKTIRTLPNDQGFYLKVVAFSHYSRKCGMPQEK